METSRYTDPAGPIDKLPQPYRMIDRLLADIIDDTIAEGALRAARKEHELAQHVEQVRI